MKLPQHSPLIGSVLSLMTSLKILLREFGARLLFSQRLVGKLTSSQELIRMGKKVKNKAFPAASIHLSCSIGWEDPGLSSWNSTAALCVYLNSCLFEFMLISVCLFEALHSQENSFK